MKKFTDFYISFWPGFGFGYFEFENGDEYNTVIVFLCFMILIIDN